MSLLTENDISRIISKSMYWDEVSKRDNAGEIYQAELWGEIKELGREKILKILAEYAKSKREAS